MNAQELASLWVEAGGDPRYAAVMAALGLQQSGGNPNADNSADPNGGSFGIWQTNGSGFAAHLGNALEQARDAVAMFKSSGLSPWSTVNMYNGSVWNTSGPVTGTTLNPVVWAFEHNQNVFEVPASGGGAATSGYGSVSGYTAAAFDESGVTGGQPGTGAGMAGTTGPGETAAMTSTQSQFDTNANTPPIAGANLHDFHGFDLSAIPQNLLGEAERNILQFAGTPGLRDTLMSRIESDYGFSSWAMTIPQVGGLLVAGSMGGWDENTFLGALRETQWWKTQNENQRAWDEISGDDPATAAQMINEARAKLTDTARQLGVMLNPTQLDKMARTVAMNTASPTGVLVAPGRYGFTQEQINQMVSGAYRYNPGQQQFGLAGELFDSAQKLAGQYMMDFTPTTIGKWVQSAMNTEYTGQGDFTTGALSGYEDYLKNQVMSRFPTMSAAVQAGITPWTFTESYRQAIGSLLEKDPDSIDLTSPQYKWVLNGTNPQTGRPDLTSIAAAEQKVMSNPTFGYQYTEQAKSTAYQVVDALAKTFGTIGSTAA